MNKSMVGIVPLVDIEKDSYWMLPGYMEGLINADCVPVILPLTSDVEMLKQIADRFDGFLFTGGHDISPVIYGEQPISSCGVCCKSRDEMESILFPFVLEGNKPILGICRGIQFINAMLGGTLYQDLPTQIVSNVEHHQSPPYDEPIHSVRIIENTPLHLLLEKNVIYVNSYHHQGIKKLSKELRAMAYSSDGIIEAVYAPGKKYVWAVQWHPEFIFSKDSNNKKLFQSFANAMK